MPQLKQLFEHDGDLHPVRRRQRVELQRMPADRQLLFVGRPGDRPIDVGETTAAALSQVQTFGGVCSSLSAIVGLRMVAKGVIDDWAATFLDTRLSRQGAQSPTGRGEA